MKKIIILSLMLLLFFSEAFAAMEPSEAYCLHNGYSFKDGYCVFDDGNKCDSQEFLNGSCGQKYVQENVPCRKEGESLYWGTEECCKGLIVKKTLGPSSYCAEPNFFQKIWLWIKSLF